MTSTTALLLALALAPLQDAPEEAQAEDVVRLVHPGPWRMLGPFTSQASPALADDPLGVERAFSRVKVGKPWKDLEEDHSVGRGKARRRLTWRPLPVVPVPGPTPLDSGRLDLAAVHEALPEARRAEAPRVVYLYRSFVADEALTVSVRAGADDGLELWWNGERLANRPGQHALDPQANAFLLEFEPGLNHLLVAVSDYGSAWAFSMQLPRRVPQEDIHRAIDRGVDWLLSRQLLDGSWGDDQGSYPNGQTALSVYTLLKSGLSPEHRAVQQALAYLQNRPTTKTYSAGCLLMALDALHDPTLQWWVEEIAADLLTNQESDGGWSYPGTHTDMSLSQYAALGLRIAAAHGVEVPDEVWLDLVKFALRHQEPFRSTDREPVAGFSYRPGNATSGSMTCAGLTILAICREQAGDRMKPRMRAQVEKSIAAGLRWLDANWRVDKNPPDHLSWGFYYLYGLERSGALLGIERIGQHEWYWEGARWLVDDQHGNGDWGDPWGNYERNTCFALLFLQRATAAAPVTFQESNGANERLVVGGFPGKPWKVKVSLGPPPSAWLDGVGQEVGLSAVRWFLRHESGEWQEQPEGRGRNFAIRPALPLAGEWQVRAEAELADGTVVPSETLTFVVEEGVDEERLAYATDSTRNLVLDQRPEATASSEQEAHPAAHACDGRMSTRWLCEPDDPEPELEIRLAKSVEAKRILLSHPWTNRFEVENQGRRARAVKVAITLDRDREPIVVEMDPSPYRKTIVVLPEPRKVSRIRVRILEVRDGEFGSSPFGFSEVELQR